MIMQTSTSRFEDVKAGDLVPELVKGPLTTAHLMRWSSAMENWHKIHYDRTFAVEHDKLPDLLVNGSLKQQFVMQLLKDYAGPEGWIWKIKFQFRAMDTVGATLIVWARVKSKRRAVRFGLVDLELGIRNGSGVESTPGEATIALPYRDGPALPYPFVPPQATEISTEPSIGTEQ
jgi:acyl dehydratase